MDLVSTDRIYQDGVDNRRRAKTMPGTERLHGRNERSDERGGDDCEEPLYETLAVELCCDFLKSRKRHPVKSNASTAGTSFRASSSSAFATSNWLRRRFSVRVCTMMCGYASSPFCLPPILSITVSLLATLSFLYTTKFRSSLFLSLINIEQI